MIVIDRAKNSFESFNAHLNDYVDYDPIQAVKAQINISREKRLFEAVKDRRISLRKKLSLGVEEK